MRHAGSYAHKTVPKSSGIEEFVAETFKLQCMQSVTGEREQASTCATFVCSHVLHVTTTGVKFYFISDPLHSSTALKQLLQQVYEFYVDYVVSCSIAAARVLLVFCLNVTHTHLYEQLKNPFYTLEQPIRCDKFDSVIEKLINTAQ